MEYNNTNFTDLLNKDLAHGDIIIFDLPDITYRYEVRSSYLYPLTLNVPEAAILRLLLYNHLINSTITEYCAKMYGYPVEESVNENRWPDCRPEDYNAITKLVFNIFELLNGISSKQLVLENIIKIPLL